MTDRIERDVLLPASPDEAWQALTDPASLELWLADEVMLDLRPGGDARFRFGEELRDGWVEEVLPPRDVPGGASGSGRLAFWWAEPDQPATRVEFTVVPMPGGGTRLRVVESRPLELLDLVGIPLRGAGGSSYGPGLVAVGAST